ncbi:F-box protein At3g54460 isoform X2 [Malania oleifera]|uniref:F-box protein At3g54460 isoform X2 n=1 Tax=Malania oleifera TaxID=397392 RepID=UPI0025ADC3BC|nr:F-box protein At3g54460 isoform X2 [Malania oleifera]
MEEDSVPDHKLCGFLRAVLSFNSTESDDGIDPFKDLGFGALCVIFGDGSEVGFRAESGAVLSPVGWKGAGKCDGVEGESGEGRKSIAPRNWRRRSIGMVKGSVSVVHQLHALMLHKCLRIVARIVGVANGENGEVRVVLLIDVYLPIALWYGWQFPKSGSTAGALFRHLSCDWKERSSLLVSNGVCCSYANGSNKSIWNISDCHVLECKLHCNTYGSSSNKLFELHEIFKSLPTMEKKGNLDCSRVKPEDPSCRSGIWVVSDDVLINILTALGPTDLVRVATTCRHLRSLAVSIMPCMKLKLFPHQQTAVEWMLQRERTAEVLPHPLYMDFLTEDGFAFYINTVSGDIFTGIVPTIRDFRGGMFCDEPGLGKTITALSLILKTQGALADPPDGAEVFWCMHNADQKCGYYELSSHNVNSGNMFLGKRILGQNARRGQLSLDKFTPVSKRSRLMDFDGNIARSAGSCPGKKTTSSAPQSMPAAGVVRCTRGLSCIKRNLLYSYEGASGFSKRKVSKKLTNGSIGTRHASLDKRLGMPIGSSHSCKKAKKDAADHTEYNDTWVQCDACRKWRKLADTAIADATGAWFCSMNTDPLYQSCSVPEESWDRRQSITYLPGFYTKGTSGGLEQNVSFFTSVLKEHYALMDSETKKALTWLAKLSPNQLSEMETVGLVRPVWDTRILSSGDVHGFHRIFQAFGLIGRVEKGVSRWYYPQTLNNLVFDLPALRIALCEPLDTFRLYLSRATLVVVPSNLVDHWKTQIERNVRPGQLRIFLWNDYRKPSAHNLAWDYDVVITTFNRLSVEWGPRKRSVLMQVHWLRVILDEGHTLGSSLALTNKLQMAVSLTASYRWILTGTPTPNTPNNQLSQLQPMLKFLREEAYGLSQKSWEAGILRPFEAEMDEGRSRLLQLLHRCMISARKIDLQTIPPCIKKVTFLNFTEEHAKTYNELVVTVRRNILMADWNDPSHVESLLNPKQWKFRSTTIRNVRLSCCVAGHIKVTDAGQDIQETMDILVGNGLDTTSEEYAFIKYNLLYGGSCLRCKEWCRLPVITPCRHLLCLDCVALDSERCTFPGCGNLYEMQSPEILTRPENPNPKWPVPKDLIELQPSYKQDNWDPDWQSTSSSKVTYVVQRLKGLQDANRETVYSMDESCGGKHIDEVLCSSEGTTSNVLLQQANCSKIPVDKVLIFSQFLEHIHVIEQQLTIAGIKFAGMYSPMHSSKKMESLAIFQHDVSCMALLMDGSAALGLDLSFVTHVFLMEPIWDRSMEEQVISRAHRMGATRPVHVETLAMRGTIEEQMLKFLQICYIHPDWVT